MKNKKEELRRLKEDLVHANDNLFYWEEEVGRIEYSIQVLEVEVEKEGEIKKEDIIMERVDTFLDSAEAGDVFYGDILRALIFTSISSDNSLKLNSVFIGEDEIFAMDGTRVIIIKNNNIPKEYRKTLLDNKYFSSDDIKSFTTRDNHSFSTIKNTIENLIESSGLSSEEYYSVSCKIGSLLSEMNYRTVERSDLKLAILEHKNGKVALNQAYLMSSMSIFNEEDLIKVLIPKNSSLAPICIKSEDIEVIILPMRVNYSPLK